MSYILIDYIWLSFELYIKLNYINNVENCAKYLNDKQGRKIY